MLSNVYCVTVSLCRCFPFLSYKHWGRRENFHLCFGLTLSFYQFYIISKCRRVVLLVGHLKRVLLIVVYICSNCGHIEVIKVSSL
jgi:hypothetical protein